MEFRLADQERIKGQTVLRTDPSAWLDGLDVLHVDVIKEQVLLPPSWMIPLSQGKIIPDTRRLVMFQLSGRGSRVLSQVTHENVGRYVTIHMDRRLITKAFISKPLEGDTLLTDLEDQFPSNQVSQIVRSLKEILPGASRG